MPSTPDRAGPTIAPAARTGVGFSSARAQLVERPAGASGVEVTVPGLAGRRIGPDEELSWLWFPERVLDQGLTEPDARSLEHLWDATAGVLEVRFTDGTRLSDVATDQYAVRLTAQAQYAARMLWVDQWNRRRVDLSGCSGRTVQRVTVLLGGPAAGTGRGVPAVCGERVAGPLVRGWLDEVRIGPAWRTAAMASDAESSIGPLAQVLTTRGTHSSDQFSRGNTAPLVAVPHGGVFGLPMTDAGSNRWPYAYQKHNRELDNRPTIQAFATSHLPSPWMGDRGVFQVMPSPFEDPPIDRRARALAFDREDELARPDLYRVRLEHGVQAELTAAEFAIGLRFSFPGEIGSIILDHHGEVREVRVRRDGALTVVEALLDDRPGTPPHFVHLRVPGVLADRTKFDGTRLTGSLLVDAAGPVEIGLGISGVSYLDAAADLRVAGSFDVMSERASRRWTEVLSTVRVEGGTPDQLTSLYSGLYRVFLYPNRAGERAHTGRPHYRSPYGSVLTQPIRDEPGAEIVEAEFTTTHGFWDTYRTAWPLLGLLTPHSAGQLAQGFVQHFHDGGWTPRWSAPGAQDCMTGTNSDTVFADLLVKDVPGIDPDAAYRSAVRNATVRPRDHRVGRKGLHPGIFRGYVDTETPEGMSWTLDGAINDWSISVMAGLSAGRCDPGSAAHARYLAEQEWFARRSLLYRTVFDERTGFFRGRLPDGGWRGADDFDPAEWGHDYTETNAWGTMFTAPHDGAGVVALHGGEGGFVRALERFFSTPETGAASYAGSYGQVIHEMTEARDVRMGMLGLSNQPAHHIPFVGMYAGRHDDAHRVIRECVDRLFVGSDLGQGYPGDEDNGEMSAWYVWAAIGLYPLAPATGSYVLVPPLFRRTELPTTGTVIEVVGPSRGPFFAAVAIDGRPWNSIAVPHALIARGARLELTLSDRPTGWGAGSRPVSASDVHGYLDPPTDVLLPGGSPLVDNTADTAVALRAGVPVEFEFEPTVASLYTVTVAEAGRHSWSVELVNDRGTAVVVDRRDAEHFDQPGQTRVFGIDAEAPAVRLRFTPAEAMSLLQLELIARSGRRRPPADGGHRVPDRSSPGH